MSFCFHFCSGWRQVLDCFQSLGSRRLNVGEQGWWERERSPPTNVTWVEFVVVSRLAPRIFLRILWFSPLLKMNISKFQFHLEPARKPGLMGIRIDVASFLKHCCNSYPTNLFEARIHPEIHEHLFTRFPHQLRVRPGQDIAYSWIRREVEIFSQHTLQ